jgi:di/tricarboxylate transporter
MQLKVPPGSLSWLSALWVLLGGSLAYTSFMRGESAFGSACLIFVLAGALIWLDVREVAWPLIVWFGIVIVLATILLIVKGIELRRFSSIILAGYTIYDLYQWRPPE